MLDHVFDEADRLLEHGLAQIVVEGGEALAVDRVVGFEVAEIQPVAGELGGQSRHPGVFQHAARLRQQHIRPVQIAGGGVPQQFSSGMLDHRK